MKDQDTFREALRDKKVPILVLDAKWHRLFSIHGKTEQISVLETELKNLLAEQGQCNSDMKDLRNLKSNLMDNVVRNMNGANAENEDSLESKKLTETSRLIEEVNEKIALCEDRLLELPYLIKEANDSLMIASMEYCYEKMRANEQEATEIAAWMKQIRIELKKNIIRKQNCETNSREIYEYMHDILGVSVIDLFDIAFENEEVKETEVDGAHLKEQQ